MANTESKNHWYRVEVNAGGETLLSRKSDARNSGDAAAQIREEFEASMPVGQLPEHYEIVVSRVFKVTSKRVRRELEMRDDT